MRSPKTAAGTGPGISATGAPSRCATHIDRNDSIQTEADELTSNVSTLAVHSTSDCHHRLVLPGSLAQYRPARPLQTEIIQASSRYHLFTSFREKGGLAFTDAMWVR